jgi:hypothetical protein
VTLLADPAQAQHFKSHFRFPCHASIAKPPCHAAPLPRQRAFIGRPGQHSGFCQRSFYAVTDRSFMSRTKQIQEKPEQPEHGPEFETITAAELCSLTSYSPRWLRDLAKMGYYPPPVRGIYQTEPTLQGLFRHERDLRAKEKGGLATKRERKLDNEIELLELKLQGRRAELLPVADVYQRLRRAVPLMKARILASGLADDEKEDCISSLARLLTDCLHSSVTTDETDTDTASEQPAA